MHRLSVIEGLHPPHPCFRYTATSVNLFMKNLCCKSCITYDFGIINTYVTTPASDTYTLQTSVSHFKKNLLSML